MYPQITSIIIRFRRHLPHIKWVIPQLTLMSRLATENRALRFDLSLRRELGRTLCQTGAFQCQTQISTLLNLQYCTSVRFT